MTLASLLLSWWLLALAQAAVWDLELCRSRESHWVGGAWWRMVMVMVMVMMMVMVVMMMIMMMMMVMIDYVCRPTVTTATSTPVSLHCSGQRRRLAFVAEIPPLLH